MLSVIEQPQPHGVGSVTYKLLINDILERAELGKQRYGEYLTSFNNRDSMIDAYQEILDLVIYIRTFLSEWQEIKDLTGATNMTELKEWISARS
jgi:hypothetical protein